MTIQDKNIVPLEKSQLEIPSETQEDLESIYYGDVADSQMNCIWY